MRRLSMSSTRKATTSKMPQAGGVGGHEDGTVLDADNGREEPGHLIEAENDGETFGLLGAADAYHDPFAVEGQYCSAQDLLNDASHYDYWFSGKRRRVQFIRPDKLASFTTAALCSTYVTAQISCRTVLVSITKGPSRWRGWTTAIASPGNQGSLRCRRNLYFKPVTKKQAEATVPKIKGAKRGNHAMGKIARITAAAWK